MKYNARQISSGEWAVFKDRTNYWTSSVRPTLEEARKQAAYYTALWHLDRVLGMVQDLELQDALEVGREANEIVDEVQDRYSQSDDWDYQDPRGWLA